MRSLIDVDAVRRLPAIKCNGLIYTVVLVVRFDATVPKAKFDAPKKFTVNEAATVDFTVSWWYRVSSSFKLS